ncbi:MAG TPA: hypothetical protein VGN63_12210 [Flavisolibacter sp.]|jgi:hypothetical protein|nr:hypothetical protein [Flavisolibacter sp.]
MPEPTSISFVISRLYVQLKVELLPSRLVHINPYHCIEKNLRLWKGISQAQAMQAQFTLEANKQVPAHQLLVSHFTHKGWSVLNLEN